MESRATAVAEPSRQTPASGVQVRGFGREAREMIPVSRGLLAYNIAYLASAWLTAVAAIALFWVHPAWYSFALAFLVVSSRQQALLNCEHECVHRKFLRSRRWNERVGRYLCAAPVGSPFSAAQARHLAHHRLLGTPEDPDLALHSGAPPKNTPIGLIRYFAHALVGGYALMVLLGPKDEVARSTPSASRHDLAALVFVHTALATIAALVTAWWVYPALWLAPLLTTTALCHLVRSFVEHAITEDEGETHANRLITISSNWLERAFVSPYFMNYHAEHHLVPSVPAPRLRELRERIGRHEERPPVIERRSYLGALRHYVRSLRGT
jgi:fatty acid desaturase